jgi:hypothetical protein
MSPACKSANIQSRPSGDISPLECSLQNEHQLTSSRPTQLQHLVDRVPTQATPTPLLGTTLASHPKVNQAPPPYSISRALEDHIPKKSPHRITVPSYQSQLYRRLNGSNSYVYVKGFASTSSPPSTIIPLKPNIWRLHTWYVPLISTDVIQLSGLATVYSEDIFHRYSLVVDLELYDITDRSPSVNLLPKID